MNARIVFGLSLVAGLMMAGTLRAADECSSSGHLVPRMETMESACACGTQQSNSLHQSSCDSCQIDAGHVGLAIGSMLTPLHGGFSCAATIGMPLHPQCHDCTASEGIPLHPFAAPSAGHCGSSRAACSHAPVAAAPCAPVRMVEQYRNGQLTLVAFPAE